MHRCEAVVGRCGKRVYPLLDEVLSPRLHLLVCIQSGQVRRAVRENVMAEDLDGLGVVDRGCMMQGRQALLVNDVSKIKVESFLVAVLLIDVPNGQRLKKISKGTMSLVCDKVE